VICPVRVRFCIVWVFREVLVNSLLRSCEGTCGMATITKKELIDRIASATSQKRIVVKRTVQQFLYEVILELGRGNRLEFRDFGVFEPRERRSRTAQNPKTLEPVAVPPRRVVKFKVGRLMQRSLEDVQAAQAEVANLRQDESDDRD